jgi:hypothetical protein
MRIYFKLFLVAVTFLLSTSYSSQSFALPATCAEPVTKPTPIPEEKKCSAYDVKNFETGASCPKKNKIDCISWFNGYLKTLIPAQCSSVGKICPGGKCWQVNGQLGNTYKCIVDASKSLLTYPGDSLKNCEKSQNGWWCQARFTITCSLQCIPDVPLTNGGSVRGSNDIPPAPAPAQEPDTY